MEPITTVALVVTGLLVVALVVALIRQGHPEEAATHEEGERHDDEGPTGEPYPTGARPAGPGAEGMAVSHPGEVVPGTRAEPSTDDHPDR